MSTPPTIYQGLSVQTEAEASQLLVQPLAAP